RGGGARGHPLWGARARGARLHVRAALRRRLRKAVKLAEELSPRVELLEAWAKELESQAAYAHKLQARGKDEELRELLTALYTTPEELAGLARVLQTRRARYQRVRRELAEANPRLAGSNAKRHPGPRAAFRRPHPGG